MKTRHVIYIAISLSFAGWLQAEHGVSYETKETDLQIFDQSRSQLYHVKNIHTYSNLEIRIPGVNPKKSEDPSDKKSDEAKKEEKEEKKDIPEHSLSPKEKSKLSALMIRANEMFYRGNFAGALTLINQAETIDPKNIQVKTMKGSLLIETKHVDEGIQYWKDALKLNPNQPDLEMKIHELEGGEK